MPSVTRPQKTQDYDQDTAIYQRPPLRKESFDATYKVLADHGSRSVIDLGSGAGDLLYFLDPAIDGYGVDRSAPLIDLAQRTRARDNVSFHCFDLLDEAAWGGFFDTAVTPRGHRLKSDGVDALTMLGSFTQFLDFRPVLDRLFAVEGWRVLVIHAPFNECPFDTRHSFFDPSAPEQGWQTMHSIPSLESVTEELEKRGATSIIWSRFELATRLEKDPDSTDRNWHVDLADGSRTLRNGMCIIFDEFILTVER